jgi:hypothetical protein
MTFQEFPSIPRLSRDMVITEKLDGTNAQISIWLREEFNTIRREQNVRNLGAPDDAFQTVVQNDMEYVIGAGSRSRWISTNQDNFGFARWVESNCDELIKLGPGRHFGEYWGQGIQRGYGLTEKRFSLFNTKRWTSPGNQYQITNDGPVTFKTQCIEVPVCHVVPILKLGTFDTAQVDEALENLRRVGSWAAAGFKNPEGVVIYHVAGGYYFKKTIEKDDKHKFEK